MAILLEKPLLATLPRADSPMLRMTINHSAGEWMLNDEPLQREQWGMAIMLGVAYTRILFPESSDPVPASHARTPACHSRNGSDGIPTDAFPRQRSNFELVDILDAQRGERVLDCGACVFAKWTHDPLSPRKSKRPECVLQVNIPVLIPPAYGTSEFYTLATVAFQRSAEQPAIAYLRDFAKRGTPLYSVHTTMILNVNLGSGYKYSVPTFKPYAATPEVYWPYFSALLARAKRQITAPPAPARKKEGGMLSVGDTPPATYTGGFFG